MKGKEMGMRCTCEHVHKRSVYPNIWDGGLNMCLQGSVQMCMYH